MPSIRAVIDPGGRWLARHLTRLSETLESFGTRLREAVASAVGETVGGIVRETVRAVLAEEPLSSTPPKRYVPTPRSSRPLWESSDYPEDDRWYDDTERYPLDDEDEDPPSNRAAPTTTPSRLPHAIAIGFHTALCWLRCRVSRFPVLTAVTVGLLTGVAAYAGGTIAAASVGLAGTAIKLLSLADGVRSSAEALDNFGSS